MLKYMIILNFLATARGRINPVIEISPTKTTWGTDGLDKVLLSTNELNKDFNVYTHLVSLTS